MRFSNYIFFVFAFILPTFLLRASPCFDAGFDILIKPTNTNQFQVVAVNPNGLQQPIAGISILTQKKNTEYTFATNQQLQEVQRLLLTLYHAELSRVNGVASEVGLPFKHITIIEEGWLTSCVGAACRVLKGQSADIYQPIGSETLLIYTRSGISHSDHSLYLSLVNNKQYSFWTRRLKNIDTVLSKLKDRRIAGYKDLAAKFYNFLNNEATTIASKIMSELGSNNTNLRFRVLDIIDFHLSSNPNEAQLVKNQINSITGENELRTFLQTLAKKLEDKTLVERVLSQLSQTVEDHRVKHVTTTVYRQFNLASVVVNVAGSTNVAYTSNASLLPFTTIETTPNSNASFDYRQTNIFSVNVNEFDHITVSVSSINSGTTLFRAVQEMEL